MNDQKIIVALDYDNQADALAFVDRIDPCLLYTSPSPRDS